MKVRSKFLALLLAMVMALGLIAPAAASEGAAPAAAESGKIVILHTNDVHCGIEQSRSDGAVTGIGYAGVAAYKAEMEAQYGAANVTLVDAGDAIQGGPIGTLTKGKALVEIMNKVGYDLAVPGNPSSTTAWIRSSPWRRTRRSTPMSAATSPTWTATRCLSRTR